MDRREFIETFNLMTDDAAAIFHNQLVLAGVNRQLVANYMKPFEQDYIYEEHFGERPSEPRNFTYNNVTITTRILHQTGIRMEDIQGADMLYEVEREKFGLIQYKKSSSTSVKNDEEQLQALISNCPDVCTHKKKRPIPVDWVPLKLNSYCGCWYSVIDEEGQKRYMHACEAEAIFRGRKSGQVKNFDIGLTRETFLELFSSCRIGAFLRAVPRGGDHRPSDYIDHLVEEQHVILEVRQQNRR